MDLFIDVLMQVTLPIVALVAIGFFAQRPLNLDVGTLNRLLVFILMPAFLIHFLSSARQPISEVWPTIYFTIVQFLLLLPVGWLIAMALRLPKALAPIIALATVYANVGNFGIPLVQLAFPPAYILHQSVITSLVTILIVTVGMWLMADAKSQTTLLGRLRMAFDTPIIPAVAIGLTLRGFEIEVPAVIGRPMEMIGMLFAPLALLGLGAQLSTTRHAELRWGPLSLVLFLKLLLAPAITWAAAVYMELPDDLVDLYVVAASTPVGVLLGVFALTYNREPGFVGTTILVSTILSPLTVTGWILAMRLT